MKLTKSKWINLAILKVVEGLGVVFIPYSAGSISLTIWPELHSHCNFDSPFDIWAIGFILAATSSSVGLIIVGVVYLNLEWAKSLKRNK